MDQEKNKHFKSERMKNLYRVTALTYVIPISHQKIAFSFSHNSIGLRYLKSRISLLGGRFKVD